MIEHLPRPITSLRVLSVLLGVLGVGAIFGGLVFVIAPTGAILGIPLSVLRYSPFDDFLIPGLILLIVFGIGSFAALWGVWLRPAWAFGTMLTRFTGQHWSWSAVVAIGLGQVIWIVTEVLMLRGLSGLHFVFGGLGLLIALVMLEPGLRRYLAVKHEPSSVLRD